MAASSSNSDLTAGFDMRRNHSSAGDCSFFRIKLPRALADNLSGHMSSTNAEPSPPQNGPAKKGLVAQLKSLDWKKDKKRILLIAAGGVLAVVIVVLIPS